MWPGNYSAYAVAREVELIRRQQQYVTQQKEIARLEEAIRRFKDWAHRVVDERHIKRARNAQRRIDRMEKVDRPVFERRKMALALRSAARGGDRVIELRGVDFDPVLSTSSSRSCAASASGSSAPTAPARPCSPSCSPATWRRPRASAGRARASWSTSSPRRPRSCRRDLTPIEIVRAAKPIGGRGGRDAREVPLRLRAAAPPDRVDERRRAHPPALPAAHALAGELPRARRADEPPRHPGRRDARVGARGLRRDGHRRQPRPLLPRPHRRPDRRGPRRRRARLRRRLQRVGAGPGRRSRRTRHSRTLAGAPITAAMGSAIPRSGAFPARGAGRELRRRARARRLRRQRPLARAAGRRPTTPPSSSPPRRARVRDDPGDRARARRLGRR